MKKYYLLILSLFLSLSYQNTKAQSEVTFYTTEGDFVIMLYDSLMPITTGNFISLIDSNFYDGIIFHRVISNFIIQGGDPLGTGFGGPGYSIPDEFDSTGQLSNIARTISMANSGPNSGGSQFFINMRSNTYLDYDKAPFTSKHPVFGIVTTNWSVVEDIAQVPVNGSDRPLTNVVMDSLRITTGKIGLNELLANQQIHIYPNPVSDQSHIYLQNLNPSEGLLKIYSQTGALVYEKTLSLSSGNNSISLQEFSLLTLKSGLYQLSIEADGQVFSGKVLRP
jgi:peptidylprolyl isomerase